MTHRLTCGVRIGVHVLCWWLEQLVLAQVHTLDYVAAVVEHALYVLSIHGACKVRIAIVLTVAAGGTYALKDISGIIEKKSSLVTLSIAHLLF